FVGSWNAYLLPLFVLKVGGSAITLPLGVAQFSSQYSSDTAGILAFTSLAIIPALVFFLALQKRIVSGLLGAVISCTAAARRPQSTAAKQAVSPSVRGVNLPPSPDGQMTGRNASERRRGAPAAAPGQPRAIIPGPSDHRVPQHRG